MDVIFSFKTTHDAILGERILLEGGGDVRVMPLPGGIAAGCGICLRIPPGRRVAAAMSLAARGVAVQGMHVESGGVYRVLPEPVFTDAFDLVPGDVVSLIGCGGKTALLHRLAVENRHLRVLLSTTTRILPPPDNVMDYFVNSAEMPLRIGINVAGSPDGCKLAGVAPGALRALRPPDGITLLESDGSRGLPLKGWAEYEPVIDEMTTVTLGVCTLWPIGCVFSEQVVHRPERFVRLTGAVPGEAITLGHVAAMAGGMFAGAIGRRILFVNQVESPRAEQEARRLAALLPGLEIVAGSVRDATVVSLNWP